MPRDWLIVGADGGIGSALATRLPEALRTSRRTGVFSPKGWDNIAQGCGPDGLQPEGLRHGSPVAALQAASQEAFPTQGVALGYVVPALRAEERAESSRVGSREAQLCDITLSLDLAADPCSWELPERISVAFLCAAVTSIETCRTKPAETRFINVERTVQLAKTLAERGVPAGSAGVPPATDPATSGDAPKTLGLFTRGRDGRGPRNERPFLVFLSTNQVFDGTIPHRGAGDEPCPRTEYGRQKAEAERAILALGGAVVRFTKVLAGVPPLFRSWIEAFRAGRAVEAFDDMFFSPVPMSAAVEALVAVAEARRPGIVQVSGECDISYADAAKRLGGTNLVAPIGIASRGISHEAAPRYTTLDTTALAELGIRVPPVQQTIEGLLMDATCHICRSGTLRLVPRFSALTRVTSDAKPFAAGGELAVCEGCGTVQKPNTAAWQADTAAVYGAYTIYHNAAGAEQNVFSGGGGQPKSRSSRLIQQVRDRVGLPGSGRMMDLGCGNGAMLRSFGEQLPGWSLVGNELSDRNRAEIEAIPQVEKLHVGEPEDVPGTFDALTLLHVLEHVPDPVSYLKRLVAKLNPGGRIIVQVPDHRHSAFDLAVADHCTHFAPDTLRAVFEAAGLEVVAAADDFVPKELTIVGVAGGPVKPFTTKPIDGTLRVLESQVEWLEDLTRRGRELAASAQGRVGVFGTSLGGAWLLGQLGSMVAFFVDEDAAKIGKTWDGRPILHPSQAPADVPVLVGLPSAIAAMVKSRVPGNLHLPKAA
jgi:dTDP-4-dehydrorhamnose reductase/SAM-dependent methyltransferase